LPPEGQTDFSDFSNFYPRNSGSDLAARLQRAKTQQGFLLAKSRSKLPCVYDLDDFNDLFSSVVDLFLFYTKVQMLGGYDSVSAGRLWKTIYDDIGGNTGSTSAATITRRHYER